ncbi:multidrug transporter MatE [Clostridium carboxidivorans P7]|uniref:Multidrug export protein MepA n=1 Tax=Clostridium carboxidivorans P7 TaxID=536227 RepID=C6PRM8_9CLOT|nr:MATE family efflux transporter [Clostridium carboxidivorans]AKN31046.1 multidrug transporter MatE [Clostridium carboxidivorans P7]EET88071.1 MATE efflux family protein [Clostridium carboxidivorans P7]EFG88689.1 MATE efflux family protein [Clostridium carboxidivorans P7]
MKKDTTTKLGTDSIGKLLFKLAAPAIIAQLVNMLYNIVDRIYIGHIPNVGVHALTGVGLTFPITMIIAAFSLLIGMGGAPRAAIKMGENKYEEAEEILGNCFISIIIISILLTIIFLLFGKNMLMAFGASTETLPYALNFLNTYVIGTIFVQITLALNAFISTQGFSKISMLSVIIGAGLSVILDPIFIFVFGMGVKGAAFANVIAQAISAIWVLKFLLGNKTKLKIRKKNMKMKKSIIIPVILLGVSPFVMQSTESLLNVTFNSSLQKYGGDIAVGSMTILSSLMQISFTLTTGLTQGAQPIISYNYGAKNNKRVKKAFKLLISCSLGVTLVYWACIMLKPGAFISIFNSDPKLLKTGIWAIQIYMATSFVLGAQAACQQTFIAVGQAKWSIFLALLRKVILLIPLIYILPNFFSDKVFAVFLSEPVSDLIATTVTVITFKIQFKKMLDKNHKSIDSRIALQN